MVPDKNIDFLAIDDTASSPGAALPALDGQGGDLERLAELVARTEQAQSGRVPALDTGNDLPWDADGYYGKNTVGAAESKFPNKQKTSKVAENTYANTKIFEEAEKNFLGMTADNPKYKYDVIGEKQSMREAAMRVTSDFAGEMEDLPVKGNWDGTDMDTAMGIAERLGREALNSGDEADIRRFQEWTKLIQEKGTEAGQRIQAFAKYTRTKEGMAAQAQNAVDGAKKALREADPNFARQMDELTNNLYEVAKNANALPADPDQFMDELRKAVEKAVDNSKMKVDTDFVERAVRQISAGADKNIIGDMVAEFEGFPILDADDVQRILEIGAEAELLPINSKARVKLEEQAFAIAAAKLPVSALDKLDAWRYMAMLTNPRTHVRNVLGNTMFSGVTRVKNTIAGALESVWDKASRAAGGDGIQRTNAVMNPLSESDRALRKAATADFDNVYGLATGGGKYNPNTMLDSQRPIFKNKALEAVRKFNSNALEWEDSFQIQKNYADSLARYMKANKVGPELFEQAANGNKDAMLLLDAGRLSAIREAQRATFRDASRFATDISQVSQNLRNSGTLSGKAGSALIEGVLPFKKTPINIIKRGVEYSPLGLANGIKTALVDVRKGTKTAAQAIDRIAAGLTGTGIMGLGMFLYDQGVLTAGPDDDSKAADFDALQGGQNYALKIGGKTYTLDWMAPAAMPLFVGAEFGKLLEKDDQDGVNDLIDSMSRIVNPVMEMSMLQGLNSTIASARYSQGSEIGAIAGNALTNYATQYVPSLLGQAARTIDPVRRSTYTDQSGTAGSLDRTLQKIENRIPGLSMTNEPYVDQWGRTQENTGGNIAGRLLMNTLSPGFYSEVNQTPADLEVERLYEQLGDSGVLPPVADSKITINGESRKLTPEEYTAYAQASGQLKNQWVEALLEGQLYQVADDAHRADMVKQVYSLANAVGRKEAVPGYEIPSTVGKLYEAYMAGIAPSVYTEYRAFADLDGNGSVTQEEATALLKVMDLTAAERAYLWQLQNKSWKNNPFA